MSDNEIRSHPALDRPAARRLRKLPRRLAERHFVNDRIAEFIDVAVE